MTLVGGYFGGLQSNDFETNPLNWDWGSFSTYYSIFSGGLSGYSFGHGIETKFNQLKNNSTLVKAHYEGLANTDYDIQALSELVNDKLGEGFYGMSFKESFHQPGQQNPWKSFPKISFDKSNPNEIGNHIFHAANFANKYNNGVINLNEIFVAGYESFLSSAAYGISLRFQLELNGEKALSFVSLGIKNPKGKVNPSILVDAGIDIARDIIHEGKKYFVYGRKSYPTYQWWTEHWMFNKAFDYWYGLD